MLGKQVEATDIAIAGDPEPAGDAAFAFNDVLRRPTEALLRRHPVFQGHPLDTPHFRRHERVIELEHGVQIRLRAAAQPLWRCRHVAQIARAGKHMLPHVRHKAAPRSRLRGGGIAWEPQKNLQGAGATGRFRHLVEQAHQDAVVVLSRVDQAVDLPRLLRAALACGDEAAERRALYAHACVPPGGETEPLLERGFERVRRVLRADAVARHCLVRVDASIVRNERDQVGRQDGASRRRHRRM